MGRMKVYTSRRVGIYTHSFLFLSFVDVTFSPPSPFHFHHFSHSKNRVARWTETGGALDAKAYTDGEMGQIRTSAFYTEKKKPEERGKNEKDDGRVLDGEGGSEVRSERV